MLHNQYFWQSHKFHRTRWFGPTANKQVPLNTPCASLNMSFIFVLFVCFNTPNSIPLLTSWQIFFLFIFIYLFIYLGDLFCEVWERLLRLVCCLATMWAKKWCCGVGERYWTGGPHGEKRGNTEYLCSFSRMRFHVTLH